MVTPTLLSPPHEAMIHDLQFDYYSSVLATASSDTTIRITSVTTQQNLHTLRGHEGPVWMVAWAHPKYGGVIASAGYEGKAIVWKWTGQGSYAQTAGQQGQQTQQTQQTQQIQGNTGGQQQQQHNNNNNNAQLNSGYPNNNTMQNQMNNGRNQMMNNMQNKTAQGNQHSTIQNDPGPNQWVKAYEHTIHQGSVNSVAWAPHEQGLHLACGSADGRVSILTCKEDGSWIVSADFPAHSMGVNAVSWAPAITPSALVTQLGGQPNAMSVRKLVTGGCDNAVKIWTYEDSGKWVCELEMEKGHTDWVRDVAWAPNIGLPTDYIASCSQDKHVIIWSKVPDGAWQGVKLKPEGFPDVVWRLSWSLSGNLLAVSSGDSKISLWKENLEGVWEHVQEMDEATEEG